MSPKSETEINIIGNNTRTGYLVSGCENEFSDTMRFEGNLILGINSRTNEMIKS